MGRLLSGRYWAYRRGWALCRGIQVPRSLVVGDLHAATAGAVVFLRDASMRCIAYLIMRRHSDTATAECRRRSRSTRVSWAACPPVCRPMLDLCSLAMFVLAGVQGSNGE